MDEIHRNDQSNEATKQNYLGAVSFSIFLTNTNFDIFSHCKYNYSTLGSGNAKKPLITYEKRLL